MGVAVFYRASIMFGFIKRFFWKPAAPEPPSVPAAQPQPVMSPVPEQGAPAFPAAAPPAGVADDRRTSAFVETAADRAPTLQEAAPPAGKAVVANPAGVIVLRLAPILAALPPNLAALVASVQGTFSLPVQTVLAQLASGAVRIPFGELRQGSPPGTFYDDGTQDKSLVNLPLPPILASLDPALLVRRPGQKLVTVPESVTSVFGQGRTLQAPVAGAPEPERPPAPVSLPKPAAPQPGASPFTRPPVPGPLPTLAPKGTGPGRAGMPFPAPKPVAMPSPVAPVAEKEVLEVALSAISESWPATVLQAVAEFQLQGATVFLPMSRLEAGLKAGRVVFTWGEVCHWLQPAPPEQSLANRQVAVELPLKVVAPLFLTRRRPGAAPRKLTEAANIADHIPVLFGRAASTPERAASAAAAAAPASGLGEVFGLPDRTEWTPPEICRRICGLEGVAGSALATSDGLAVAAQLPAGLNAETVAAFLPQIFGRASQSAGEMQLGPVTSVVLAAGAGRCAIYKAGQLYLAVLGHAGAALPEAMLGRIAAELAKRNP